MNRKDYWKTICYFIDNHKSNNTKEGAYQKTIENIFDVLGWSENEICSQFPVPMGVATKRADIVLKNNDKKVIIIEIKRPNSETKEQVQNQLSSYMRILRMDFGLCIGGDLKFFYDNPNNKKDNIELIFETDFNVDSENGLKFIELFAKSTFSEEKLYEFCAQKLKDLEDEKQAKEIERQTKIEVEKLLENDAEIIRESFFEFLSEKYSNNISEILKDRIYIKVKKEQSVAIEPNDFVYSKIKTEKIRNDKSTMDFSTFKFNGISYNKGRLVNTVVKKVVKDNPQITVSELKQKFPDSIQGSSGVFDLKENAEGIFERTGHKRHYIKPHEVIQLADNWISTSTQWTSSQHRRIYKTSDKIRLQH